jgi:hypothetical protein
MSDDQHANSLPGDPDSALCRPAMARGVVPGRNVTIVTSYGIGFPFIAASPSLRGA